MLYNVVFKLASDFSCNVLKKKKVQNFSAKNFYLRIMLKPDYRQKSCEILLAHIDKKKEVL